MSAQVSPDRVSRAVRAYFLAIRAMDPEALPILSPKTAPPAIPLRPRQLRVVKAFANSLNRSARILRASRWTKIQFLFRAMALR
jgi:hypothetical protein